VPAGWTEHARTALDGVRALLPALAASIDEIPRGTGVLRPDVARSHGVTGAPARGSGVDLDLRRDEPYLAYGDLDIRVPLRSEGDAQARTRCVVEQVDVALGLAAACLDRLPSGAVALRLPKTVKAPEGATSAWTENPLGVQGYYLVSRGDRTPWRLAMRTASFNNVSALGHALPGTRLEDLETVLASFFFVIGDIDK
jgi:NADH-quinone oxidoreductase subunit D